MRVIPWRAPEAEQARRNLLHLSGFAKILPLSTKVSKNTYSVACMARYTIRGRFRLVDCQGLFQIMRLAVAL